MVEIRRFLGEDFLEDPRLADALNRAQQELNEQGITADKMKDMVVSSLVLTAEALCKDTVTYKKEVYNNRDQEN